MWSLDDFESPQKGSFGTYLSSANYRDNDRVEEKHNLLVRLIDLKICKRVGLLKVLTMMIRSGIT